MTQSLTIIRPDDFHLHVRDGETLAAVLPFSARQMGRALIMPNLKPPVTRVADALAYQRRIMHALPENSTFQPLMTLYLTDHTQPEWVYEAQAAGIMAFKLYPAGATTHSDAGVTDLFQLMPVLKAMAETGMPLLVHGEVTDSDIDIFDREAVFIERVLTPLLMKLPTLKIVFEHITTRQAAQLVIEAGNNMAATVTPQHLLLNRNDLLVGGIKPHYFCLPVLKQENHRQALVEAVCGAHSSRFFLGTDSAPHTRTAKESACGCAGIFSAPIAIELYAEIFDRANALHKLQAFASENGARFYGLPINQDTITLYRQDYAVPPDFGDGKQIFIPLRAGTTVGWTLVD